MSHGVTNSVLLHSLNLRSSLACTLQFYQIGSFFTRLLSQARHRGAFEMAFSGFKQFCCRLWLLPPHPSLVLNCHTPSQWLQSGLQSLQTTSTGNITRRSAGLPFYFLVCAMGHCTPKDTHLGPPSVMRCSLLHIAVTLTQCLKQSHLLCEQIEL